MMSHHPLYSSLSLAAYLPVIMCLFSSLKRRDSYRVFGASGFVCAKYMITLLQLPNKAYESLASEDGYAITHLARWKPSYCTTAYHQAALHMHSLQGFDVERSSWHVKSANNVFLYAAHSRTFFPVKRLERANLDVSCTTTAINFR